MTLLPDKPSELMRLALKDLKACEADPAYKINMWVWHEPEAPMDETPVCLVCFAGAVLAQSIDLEPEESVMMPKLVFFEGSQISRADANKLHALNSFRGGHINGGFSYLGIKKPETLPTYTQMPIYEYATTEAYHASLEHLAQLFEDAGA